MRVPYHCISVWHMRSMPVCTSEYTYGFVHSYLTPDTMVVTFRAVFNDSNGHILFFLWSSPVWGCKYNVTKLFVTRLGTVRRVLFPATLLATSMGSEPNRTLGGHTHTIPHRVYPRRYVKKHIYVYYSAYITSVLTEKKLFPFPEDFHLRILRQTTAAKFQFRVHILSKKENYLRQLFIYF